MNLLFPVIHQTIFGLVSVLVSLPILNALHGSLGLGTPPRGGVTLLGFAILFAWASGGALGALIGESGRRARGLNTSFLAGLAGLLWGVVLCAFVAPLYAQSVVDDVTRQVATQTASTAFRERGRLLDRARDVRAGKGGAVASEAFSSAKKSALEIARSGAARLPSLAMLFWVLLGPAIAASIESRKAARR